MIKSFSFIIFLLGITLKSIAQLATSSPSFGGEVKLPLTCNPVIKEYLVKQNQELRVKSQERRLFHLDSCILHLLTAPSPDTLSLPFIDDFSKPVGIWPDSKLWLDSGCFINTTFCDNPPTVGVATFDGIDKYGNPYNSSWSGGSSEPCDTLTSHCINLGGLTAADNVILSFYYQPQGLGIAPNADDTLVLEFRDPTDTVTPWHWIWSHAGEADTAFQRVNIPIDTGMVKYLYNGFQFHFFNYAIPNANVNHWNIDYVVLDKNRNLNDSLDPRLTDVGFISPPTSILNEYQSMPWQHYKVAPSSFMKSSLTDSIRSIWFHPQSFTDSTTILRENGSRIFLTVNNQSSSGFNSVTYFNPASITNFIYDTLVIGDSVTFTIKDYINKSNADSVPSNDTVYYHQNFFNYYAYDDGSAESSYGLTTNGSIAYQFDIKKADTLIGLQIYFNPTGYPVHTETFEICYWTSLSPNPQHTTQNLVPANIDSINGFVNYYFDVPQSVSAGTIYIGIIQDFSDPIGIGFDVNTNSGSKIFYNIFSQWYSSTALGSLMMRPLFGKDVRVGVDEITSSPVLFSIYPNPASKQLTVDNGQLTMRNKLSTVNCQLSIYNVFGEKVYNQQLRTSNIKHQTTIDVSNFSEGVYFVQLIDEKSGARSTQKLLIQH